MPDAARHDDTITIRLPRDTTRRLRLAADQEDRPVAYVIRRAIERELAPDADRPTDAAQRAREVRASLANVGPRRSTAIRPRPEERVPLEKRL